jgi:hypothetical protein
MKYSNEVVVAIPRSELIKKLDDPNNMKHWQRGLQSAEQLNGVPGQEGAQMQLEYQMGKRNIKMVETIIKRAFPDEFHATYETKGVYNLQKNYFIELDEHSTKWVSESEFRFSSLGMKLMGWLMPGAFKKQSQKYLEDFKNFAEKGASINK